MGLLNRLLGRFLGPKPADEPGADLDGGHLVLIRCKLVDDSFGDPDEVPRFHEFQDRLEAAAENAKAGMLDGDGFGLGYCEIFMYGPDADKLWAAIESEVRREGLRAGSHVIKRYGPPEDGVREERIDL